jgi:Tfp pilus assembly protein PilF
MAEPDRKTPFQVHYEAALCLLDTGDFERAAKRFLQAAIADPEEWNNSADRIAKSGHPEVAIAALQQVIRLHDGRKDVLAASWCTIGNILYDCGNNDLALEHFQESWKHWKTGGAAANIALMNLRRGRLEEATKWIEMSLAIDPWSAEAQMVQADLTFNKGDYKDGFRQYECRWRSRRHGLKKLASNKPEWTGQGNGHLLVFGEQGMGDVILALRYARLIKERGLEQTWVIQPTMKTLAESLGLIDRVLAPGDEIPDNDFHLSSCSLPRVLESIPSARYLTGLSRTTDGVYRIGICWRGNSANPNNPFRSTALAQWNGILETPGVEFHSFQFGDGEEEAKAFPQVKTYAHPADWLETRNRVSAMDLIISVDTAMVHLAGAMGVPCWCALHCRPYWAYPLCSGETTPWYPSVKLFRQQKEFEWTPVFERIADELRTYANCEGRTSRAETNPATEA